MAALLGFGPLQRHQHRRPGSLGFASPDTFRLQGFAPSCRLPSSSTFRPCFVPVPLMGFPLQGFSPSRSLRTLSAAVTLVALATAFRTPSEPEMRDGGSVAFRALLSARIRHLPVRGEPHRKAAALLVLRPLRSSPSPRLGAGATDPLRSFVIPVAQDKSHAREATALQGLDRVEVGWSLARLPPFLVFCTSCPGRRFSNLMPPGS
jgi:hypothetical protein